MSKSKMAEMMKIAAQGGPIADPLWGSSTKRITDSLQAQKEEYWRHITNPSVFHQSMIQGPNQQGRAIAGDQYYLAVTKVVNGYVLQCGDETWVAKDEDELKDLFITAIVTKKMG